MYLLLKNIMLRQYLVVIAANLCVISVGMNLAWPSPVLVKLRSNDTVLTHPITDEEGSWIVSIGYAFGTFFSFLPALMLNRIGRKWSIIVSCIPRLLIAILFSFSTHLWMVLLGRACTGPLESLSFSAVSVFSSEIANKEVRGALVTLLQLSCSLGMLATFCIGPYASYVNLNVIITSIIIVTMVPLFFLPDSPYFLYIKGKTEESKKLLINLRVSEQEVSEEIKEYAAIQSLNAVTFKELIKNKAFLKAAGIVVVLNSGNQLTGFNAVQFYLQTILESTQTVVLPEIASVIIGLIQFLASFCTYLVTDRFGRKPILVWTLVGNALGMFALGTFFKIKEIQGEVNGVLNYVPIVSLILFIFCFGAGLGSIVMPLSSELFEGRTRATGFSIAMTTSCATMFLVTKLFATVTIGIGAPATYWGFCVFCILIKLFIIFCLPETKNRSFADIQRELSGESITKVDKNNSCCL